MTQSQRLEAYLNQHGRINPLVAWNELGIYRLSARLHELRSRMTIETRSLEVTNRFGEACRVAEYVLIEK